jgi:hypothetical protein
MKFRKSDLTVEDFKRGRNRSELKQALDEFIAMESDVVVIDPKENGYSSAESCRSSLRNAIKRYGYTSIKASSINSLVYVYKRNL